MFMWLTAFHTSPHLLIFYVVVAGVVLHIFIVVLITMVDNSITFKNCWLLCMCVCVCKDYMPMLAFFVGMSKQFVSIAWENVGHEFKWFLLLFCFVFLWFVALLSFLWYFTDYQSVWNGCCLPFFCDLHFCRAYFIFVLLFF